MPSDYTLLYPHIIEWDKFIEQKPDVPFTDGVIDFLNALSMRLIKDKGSRSYPDVVTFAFFCRKGNLQKLRCVHTNPDTLRFGYGTLFHIAPSNVPINFGYSLVAGLLAGNNNIVRVSSKPSPQVSLIIKHLHQLRSTHLYEDIANRIALVRYDRTSEASAMFSSLCNIRVIWGGDSTIANIRQNPLPPRAFDVCFADRYSIAAINPDAIIKASNTELKKLAAAFYNDTYLFDQNACSAPHIIFWVQENTKLSKDTKDNIDYLEQYTPLNSLEEAKKRFWTAIHEHASAKYQLQAIMSVNKLTAFYKQAACMSVHKEYMPDNIVVRTKLNEIPKNIEDFRCSCGYFSEYAIETLDEISPVVNIKYQTLAYYGFKKNELIDFVTRNRLQGIDRIVPIGETTTFSLTWDGYNLIDSFTRKLSVLG